MSTSTNGFVFEKVNVAYGSQVVLEDVNAHFEKNHIHVLIGASGVGKSTLLNTLLGMIQPVKGIINYDGQPYHPQDHIISLVPQNYGLLPWQTAFQAIHDAQTITHRMDSRLVEELVDSLALNTVMDKYPHQMSGGQRQRVALARAFSVQADLLLLDEPFGALDALNRESSQKLFLKLWHQHPATTFLITHDIEEALLIGDTLTVLAGNPANIVRQMKNLLSEVALNERRTHPNFYHWVEDWKGAIQYGE